MIIMCMILSSPSRSAAPLKIGGSLMYLHATGTIPDPGKLEPYRPEETRVLAELHAEGVVKSLFRLSDRRGCTLSSRPTTWRRPAPSLPGTSGSFLAVGCKP